MDAIIFIAMWDGNWCSVLSLSFLIDFTSIDFQIQNDVQPHAMVHQTKPLITIVWHWLYDLYTHFAEGNCHFQNGSNVAKKQMSN